MGLWRARRMRGLAAWFRTEAAVTWLPLVVAIAMFGDVFAWQAFRSNEERPERPASSLADAVAQDIGRNMEQFDLILRTVMGGERTPASPDLTREQRNTILFEHAPSDRNIDFLDVLDVDGGVLASLRPGEPPRNWATRDYFYALRDNPTKEIYAGAPFSTKSEASVGFTVSRRIAAGDGRFAGVVVMGVRLAAVRELLNRQKLGTSEAVTLMRDDGTVLMRLPFDLKDIGHRIEPFAPFLAFSRSGQSSISTRVTSDDAAQRLVFRRVGGYPLVVGVATLPGEDGRGWPYLPWPVGGAATVGIGCWLLVRRLRRERRLRNAAQHQSTEALLVGRRT